LRYVQFLREVHRLLAPPTYLEIGVRRGNSLSLAGARAIGIDPDIDLKPQYEHLARTAALFEETSDAYFARPDPLAPFEGRPPALAFIDGMHLFEFALRDFVNVERHAHWTSVVVFDDIFPREVAEAARDRQTKGWTGDIHKIPGVLARHRPDLLCLRVDTRPTGLLLVLGLDPASRVLADRYDAIVAETVAPDPPDVPAEVLERRGALEPERILEAAFWSVLRDARDGDEPREQGVERLRRAVRRDLRPGLGGRLRRILSPTT